MALVGFLGDVHGDIRNALKYIEQWQQEHGHLDAVVQCGDFGIFKFTDFYKYWRGEYHCTIPLYVCPGNHEDFSLIYKWMQEHDRIQNMHLMPDGSVTDVCGVKVGAIWGNFSYKSWNNPVVVEQARANCVRSNQASRKAMHIYRPSTVQLLSAGQIDVLVTHDCSAGMSPMYGQPPDFIKQQLGLDRDERAAGCPALNEIHEICKPKYHFFGHFHKYSVEQIDPVKVTCLHAFNYNPKESFEVVEF